MSYWLMELRVAFRSLFKRPQFVFTVIFTLAFSMAAVISFFSVSSLLLLQDLPYKEADKQYAIDIKLEIAGKEFPALPLIAKRLTEQQDIFESMLIYNEGSGELKVDEQSFATEAAFVSSNYFKQLGLKTHIGETFSADESYGKFSPKVVLSYKIWNEIFSADNNIIGQQIQLNNDFFTIQGVLTQGAEAPDNIVNKQPELYLPLDYSAADFSGNQQISTGQAYLIGKGIKENALQYQQKIQPLVSEISQSINHPLVAIASVKSYVTPLRQAILGNSEQLSLALLMGAIMLLLVACTNLANLFIARSVESTRKFAIHMAVGAQSKQLFNKLFIESALLTISSGVMALLLSVWGIELIKIIAQDSLPRVNYLSIDGYTLLFSIIICSVLSLCFSYFPFVISKRSGLSENMRSSGKGVAKQSSNRSRRTLLIGQSSLVTLLLCLSSLFLNTSLTELNKVTGFNTNNRTVLVLTPKTKTISHGELASALPSVKQALKELPSVSHIALSNSSPIVMSGVIFPVRRNLASPEHMLSVNKVESNFFDVLGIEFKAGNSFANTNSDDDHTVILNQSSVKLLLGNDWRLGDSLIVAGRPHKLIGVIKDTFRSRYLTELSGNELVFTQYNALSQQMLPSEQMVLNIHHDEVDTFNISDVYNLIQTDRSSFDIESINSLASLLEDEVYIARITAVMAISFCVLTLALGTVGVWGIVNYNAKTRRFEFGVRMALGAKRAHLLTMMLIENSVPLLLGITSGLIFALLASTQITHLSLFMEQIGQFNVPLIILMLITLVLAMLFAVINPVNQVLRNAPMNALKQDD